MGRHLLEVTKDGELTELEVIHEGCPEELVSYGDGFTAICYGCDVDQFVADGALETDEFSELAGGTYEIEPWVEEHRAIPGVRGPEWSSGLHIVRKVETP